VTRAAAATVKLGTTTLGHPELVLLEVQPAVGKILAALLVERSQLDLLVDQEAQQQVVLRLAAQPEARGQEAIHPSPAKLHTDVGLCEFGRETPFGSTPSGVLFVR
jgi:hypothetical protein